MLLPLVNTPLIEYTLEWLAMNKVEEVSRVKSRGKSRAKAGAWSLFEPHLHCSRPGWGVHPAMGSGLCWARRARLRPPRGGEARALARTGVSGSPARPPARALPPAPAPRRPPLEPASLPPTPPQIFVFCCAHADQIKKYLADSKWTRQRSPRIVTVGRPRGGGGSGAPGEAGPGGIGAGLARPAAGLAAGRARAKGRGTAPCCSTPRPPRHATPRHSTPPPRHPAAAPKLQPPPKPPPPQVVARNCLSAGEALRALDQKDIIKGDFLLVSGDTVANVDLGPALAAHRARRERDKNAIMTMVCVWGGRLAGAAAFPAGFVAPRLGGGVFRGEGRRSRLRQRGPPPFDRPLTAR